MIGHEKSFHTISFLRVGATELRQNAYDEPEPISTELRRIAQDWDARAVELEAAAGNQMETLIAK